MKTLEELQPLIIKWANDKDLIHKENAPKQRLKLIEECGELASAILKDDIDSQKDAIGDIFVVLIILSEQLGCYDYDFEDDGDPDSIDMLIKGIVSDFYVEGKFSYLVNTSRELRLDLTECANIAWNQIKDRKGNTVNGTFIKD